MSLENASDHIFTESAMFRRDLLELRRLALAQREAIRPLARGECDYVAPMLGRRFSHVSDHLTRVVELTDSLREVLGAIRENYQSLMARRTNEIMRTLTILSTILLPMSLIAGIYGMNLKTWPAVEEPCIHSGSSSARWQRSDSRWGFIFEADAGSDLERGRHPISSCEVWHEYRSQIEMILCRDMPMTFRLLSHAGRINRQVGVVDNGKVGSLDNLPFRDDRRMDE